MADKKINIKDLDKADVLAVLYNASKPQGMGFMSYDDSPMTREQARELIDAGRTSFDYLNGRVMKINLSGDEFNPLGYDRDNGQGAARHAISALYENEHANPPEVRDAHISRTRSAAAIVRENLHDESGLNEDGSYHIGLSDVTDVLGPKVDGAIKKLDDLKD